MTNFQIGIIAIFAILAIIGVFAFAGIGGFGGDKNSIGSVEIWGTIPNVVMNDLISEISREDKNFLGIKYVLIYIIVLAIFDWDLICGKIVFNNFCRLDQIFQTLGRIVSGDSANYRFVGR